MPPLDANPPSSVQQQRRRHTSSFRAKTNHPTSYDESPAFRGPLVFGRGNRTSDARERIRHYYLGDDSNANGLTVPEICPAPLQESTPTKRMLKRIVDHLAYRDAPVDVKEVAESVEFYLRSRKRLLGSAKASASAPSRNDGQSSRRLVTVYDLCAGHGLTGMLFAACNPRTVRTVLVDQTEPPSHKLLRRYLAEVCPWIGIGGDHDDDDCTSDGGGAVRFVPAALGAFRDESAVFLPPNDEDGGSSACSSGPPPGPSVVISTHACGSLTDRVLEYAVESRADGVAVMPCCYTGTDKGVPYGLKRALGVAWSADIRRSFYLQENGYHSDFATIPTEITPMNRILVGERRGR